ncbi:MAG: acyl-CoA thioesterase [Deltaproteobacteria bacterium]|nr:acyl-CoA thioesterase [Deltaproteobacteria bacterium]
MQNDLNKTTYRVIYGDVDAMRIAYYANYLRWFEIGRAELMRKLDVSYAEVEAHGFRLPVTEAHCQYLAPIRYDDLLVIEANIAFIRRASLRFDYLITHEGDTAPLADGYTVHACLNTEGKIVRLPDFVIQALS